MDIQMPKMTGIDAAKKIRLNSRNEHTPIIPVTGFSRIVNADMCREAGMNGFMEKPVKVDKLETETRRALAREHKLAAYA